MEYFYDAYQVNVLASVEWEARNPYQTQSYLPTGSGLVRVASYNVDNFGPYDVSRAKKLAV